MESEDVEAVTLEHIDDVLINSALQSNSTEMMMRLCECSPGGANTSSAHCRLVKYYNITLLELCNDQQLLQQQRITQVSVRQVTLCYQLLVRERMS